MAYGTVFDEAMIGETEGESDLGWISVVEAWLKSWVRSSTAKGTPKV